MTHDWGTDNWGDGYWGGHADYTKVMAAAWPFDPTRPSSDDALYDFLRALDWELGYYEAVLSELKDQRQLTTATDEELDKLSQEVGIIRQENEGDDRLRFRTSIRKAATRSTGTFEDVAQLLESIFGDDAEDITVTNSVNDPVVELRMPSSLLADIPITDSELATALEPAIPENDTFEVVTGDTWLLGQSGSQGLGKGGLL